VTPHYYDFLALGAATCWAASAVISAEPAKHLGAIAFVRWRMFFVALLLWSIAVFASRFPPLGMDTWGLMALSGLVGIFLGDTTLFAAMNRLGPRRSGVLFATHALFTALLGYLFLNERLGAQVYLGAAITVAGVMVAVAWGQHKSAAHPWDSSPNTLSGIALALTAAFAQALGALIAKPAMDLSGGFDPVLASAVRVTVALLALVLVGFISPRFGRAQQPPTRHVLFQTAVSGWVGMGLGVGLLLWSLREGPVGSAGVLSALSPVIILQLLWLKFGRAPASGAWIGAILAIAGVALVLLR
jgi:drug/metabolite transporter (DMT)-like permease